MIAFATSSVRDPISVSILIYTKLSIFTIGYTLNQRPYQRTSLNLNEILNETFILMTGYYLFIFSEWIYNTKPSAAGEYSHDPVTKYNFGYTYIALLIAVLGLNMSFVLYEQYKSAIRAFQKYIYYKKWGTYYKKVLFDIVIHNDKM